MKSCKLHLGFTFLVALCVVLSACGQSCEPDGNGRPCRSPYDGPCGCPYNGPVGGPYDGPYLSPCNKGSGSHRSTGYPDHLSQLG